MKRLLIILFLLTKSATAGPEAWLQNGLITPDMITILKPELELTVDQEERMKTIVTEARVSAEPLETKVREQQKNFNQALRQPETTPEQAGMALTQLMDAEASVKQLQLRTLLSLRDVLTPEQRKKAVALAPARQAKQSDLETRVREKAARLTAAVDALGIPPTKVMKERGAEVEGLIREGYLAKADKELDQLVIESGVDETTPAEVPDFSSYDPGNTDLEVLKQRYLDVEIGAQTIISIPRVRQFLQAKQALEEAKAAEDAVAVGRILTWAESVLKQ